MHFQITGRNYEISDRAKKLVEEKVGLKLDRLLSHYNEELKAANITIEKETFAKFKVKFDMQLPGKHSIFAQTEHRFLKSALIDLEQEVSKEIKRVREKQATGYSLG